MRCCQLWGVGVLDFAGSLVVHLTGGSTALIATYLLGPRRGRFYDHRGVPLEIPKEFPGHSVALQMLGGEFDLALPAIFWLLFTQK